MKRTGIAVCIAAMSSLGVMAQTNQTKTETKITVKDGTEVKVTGCVAPDLNHTGYILTNVADKSGALHNYMLLTDDTDLAKHVGHRLQIEGRVTDRGDAKVKVETKTETKVKDGDDRESKSKSEISGDAVALPYLGVKSFKMLAASCP
jgi:hypothetical protein